MHFIRVLKFKLIKERMKILIIFWALAIAMSLASPVSKSKKYEDQKISSGAPIKNGEFLDFCYLKIRFVTIEKTCGCTIFEENVIATTARCLYE